MTAAFIPILNVLLPIFNCRVQDNGTTFTNLSLSDDNGNQLVCFGRTHLLFFVPSVVLLSLFFVIAILASLTLHSWDPMSRGLLDRLHSRAETSFIAMKAALSATFLFSTSSWLPPVVLIVISMLYLSIGMYYLRFHRTSMNEWTVSQDVVFLLSSILAVLTLRFPNSLVLTILLVVTFPVGLFIGRRLVAWRLGGLSVFPPPVSLGGGSFEEQTSHLKLRHPPDVDIAVRFIYLRPTDERARLHAQHVYSLALRLFPRSELVLMSYIHFMAHFSPYIETVVEHEALLGRINPGLDARFFLYRQRREREQTGHGESIISVIEFTNRLKLALRHHLAASHAIDWFWTALAYIGVEEKDGLRKRVVPINLAELSNALHSINASESSADKYYASLLVKFSNRPKLLRAIGAFLFSVKNRPDEAPQLLARADEMERLEEMRRFSDGQEDTVRSTFERAQPGGWSGGERKVLSMVSGTEGDNASKLGEDMQEVVQSQMTSVELERVKEDIAIWRLFGRISTANILKISGYVSLVAVSLVVMAYCIDAGTHRTMFNDFLSLLSSSFVLHASLAGGATHAESVATDGLRRVGLDYYNTAYSATPLFPTINDTLAAIDEGADFLLGNVSTDALRVARTGLRTAGDHLFDAVTSSSLSDLDSMKRLEDKLVTDTNLVFYNVGGGAEAVTFTTDVTFSEGVSRVSAFFGTVIDLDEDMVRALATSPEYGNVMLSTSRMLLVLSELPHAWVDVFDEWNSNAGKSVTQFILASILVLVLLNALVVFPRFRSVSDDQLQALALFSDLPLEICRRVAVGRNGVDLEAEIDFGLNAYDEEFDDTMEEVRDGDIDVKGAAFSQAAISFASGTLNAHDWKARPKPALKGMASVTALDLEGVQRLDDAIDGAMEEGEHHDQVIKQFHAMQVKKITARRHMQEQGIAPPAPDRSDLVSPNISTSFGARRAMRRELKTRRARAEQRAQDSGEKGNEGKQDNRDEGKQNKGDEEEDKDEDDGLSMAPATAPNAVANMIMTGELEKLLSDDGQNEISIAAELKSQFQATVSALSDVSDVGYEGGNGESAATDGAPTVTEGAPAGLEGAFAHSMDDVDHEEPVDVEMDEMGSRKSISVQITTSSVGVLPSAGVEPPEGGVEDGQDTVNKDGMVDVVSGSGQQGGSALAADAMAEGVQREQDKIPAPFADGGESLERVAPLDDGVDVDASPPGVSGHVAVGDLDDESLDASGIDAREEIHPKTSETPDNVPVGDTGAAPIPGEASVPGTGSKPSGSAPDAGTNTVGAILRGGSGSVVKTGPSPRMLRLDGNRGGLAPAGSGQGHQNRGKVAPSDSSFGRIASYEASMEEHRKMSATERLMRHLEMTKSQLGHKTQDVDIALAEAATAARRITFMGRGSLDSDRAWDVSQQLSEHGGAPSVIASHISGLSPIGLSFGLGDLEMGINHDLEELMTRQRMTTGSRATDFSQHMTESLFSGVGGYGGGELVVDLPRGVSVFDRRTRAERTVFRRIKDALFGRQDGTTQVDEFDIMRKGLSDVDVEEEPLTPLEPEVPPRKGTIDNGALGGGASKHWGRIATIGGPQANPMIRPGAEHDSAADQAAAPPFPDDGVGSSMSSNKRRRRFSFVKKSSVDAVGHYFDQVAGCYLDEHKAVLGSEVWWSLRRRDLRSPVYALMLQHVLLIFIMFSVLLVTVAVVDTYERRKLEDLVTVAADASAYSGEILEAAFHVMRVAYNPLLTESQYNLHRRLGLNAIARAEGRYRTILDRGISLSATTELLRHFFDLCENEVNFAAFAGVIEDIATDATDQIGLLLFAGELNHIRGATNLQLPCAHFPTVPIEIADVQGRSAADVVDAIPTFSCPAYGCRANAMANGGLAVAHYEGVAAVTKMLYENHGSFNAIEFVDGNTTVDAPVPHQTMERSNFYYTTQHAVLFTSLAVAEGVWPYSGSLVFFDFWSTIVQRIKVWFAVQVSLRILVGIVYAVVFSLVLIPLFQRLQKENERTSFLLRMLPQDIVAGSSCVKAIINSRRVVKLPLLEKIKIHLKRPMDGFNPQHERRQHYSILSVQA